MPLTYPPLQYTQSSAPPNVLDGMRDIVWFLNGSNPTKASAIVYKCIDCYDGVTREQPTDGDMDNLSGSNKWKPGTGDSLSPSHWCVLETPGNAFVVAKWQMYCRCETFATFSTSLVPLANWTVGGPVTGTPTLPAAILGQPPSPGSGDGRFPVAANRIYSVLYDEGMCIIRSNQLASINLNWQYVGEINSMNTEADDPRPFIFPNLTSTGNLRPGQADWRRISLADSVTHSTIRIDGEAFNSMDATNTHNDLGNEYVCKVNCWSILAGDLYHMGFLRNIGGCAKDIGSSSVSHTLGYDGSDFRFEMWSRSEDDPKMVTLHEPATALTAHTVVTELSVPDALIPAVAGGGDTANPVVVYVSPTPNSTIRSNTRIVIDVTDDQNFFSGIQLRVRYNSAAPARPTETIHGGDVLGVFEPFFQECTVESIVDGFRFTLTRVDPNVDGTDTGWPSTPTFVATPVDSSGNAI